MKKHLAGIAAVLALAALCFGQAAGSPGRTGRRPASSARANLQRTEPGCAWTTTQPADEQPKRGRLLRGIRKANRILKRRATSTGFLSYDAINKARAFDGRWTLRFRYRYRRDKATSFEYRDGVWLIGYVDAPGHRWKADKPIAPNSPEAKRRQRDLATRIEVAVLLPDSMVRQIDFDRLVPGLRGPPLTLQVLVTRYAIREYDGRAFVGTLRAKALEFDRRYLRKPSESPSNELARPEPHPNTSRSVAPP